MQEKMKMHEEISLKLTEECKAIALEAAYLRPVITDFEKHLIDERSLFGQIRSDIAKLCKRTIGDKENKESTLVREKYLEADKLLGA